jgi:hypothetical protein
MSVDQAIVVSHSESIANHAGTLPSALNRAEILAKMAEDQLPRVKVIDGESMGRAADLVKTLTSSINEVEEAQKRQTGPLKALIDLIVKEGFAPPIERLRVVKAAVKGRIELYAAQLREEAAKQAAKEQQEREAAAIAAAEAQQAAGDTRGAAQIIAAGTVQVEPEKTNVVGAYGARVTDQTIVSGEIADLRQFLLYVSGAKVNNSWAFSDEKLAKIVPQKSLLNELAKLVESGAIPAFTGLKVAVTTKARVA